MFGRKKNKNSLSERELRGTSRRGRIGPADDITSATTAARAFIDRTFLQLNLLVRLFWIDQIALAEKEKSVHSRARVNFMYTTRSVYNYSRVTDTNIKYGSLISQCRL